jgi:hypothetical protein
MQAAPASRLRTRPCAPRTNGKAKRFIQTLLRGWTYGPDGSLGGLPPLSRVSQVRGHDAPSQTWPTFLPAGPPQVDTLKTLNRLDAVCVRVQGAAPPASGEACPAASAMALTLGAER